ncbi:MAG TPA: hypothetical protein VFZ61_04410, partial [Polyangiales bacterium]
MEQVAVAMARGAALASLLCVGACSGAIGSPAEPQRPAGQGGALPGDDPSDPRDDLVDPGAGRPPGSDVPTDPGRGTLRRLNRTEYNNTVR